ncbi:hypothetical protein COO20_17835 [Thalassospira marina]|uniref:Uncharacterized protein n=1 Tax=Thalassospira marina TaxID=2048283 RepID=A0A2N3KN81_9PROT|nr:hypothetical protein COO20_17835 [Thalassospira marina]
MARANHKTCIDQIRSMQVTARGQGFLKSNSRPRPTNYPGSSRAPFGKNRYKTPKSAPSAPTPEYGTPQ